MDINVDELVKQEIKTQVKQRLSNHFDVEIKKVLTRSTIKNEIMEHTEVFIKESIDIENAIEKLDLSKIHNDIVTRVSYAIARKLDCEDYL